MEPAPTIALMSAFPYQAPGESRASNWVKADLHVHTSEDPLDEVNYTALELVERAHARGFRVLAITLHDAVLDDERVFGRARELGMTLIPAVERRIEGADVVILNLTPEESEAITSFDDLRRLRWARGSSLLTIAPHPFYRVGGSIGRRIEQHLDCFDAIEHCHLHLPLVDLNRAARRLAHRHNKPLVATSDCHRKAFFGQNFSHLGLTVPEGEVPTVTAVFDAIRAHRVRRTAPRNWLRTLGVLFYVFVQHPVLQRLPGSKRNRGRASRGPAAEDAGYPVANERAVI